MKSRAILIGEIRYAIRLTERTARLYRRAQTVGVFMTIVGGSGALSLLSPHVPQWIGLSGSALLAVAGAAMIAIRPADKAAMNESDKRRYAALIAKQASLTDEQLATAIDEAHQADTQEVEPLRAVAYNDVAVEIGRPDQIIPLSPMQRFLASLA